MKTGISKHKRKALLLLTLLGSSIGSYAATTAGSITLTGAEQFNSSNGMWDAGNVTVSINGYVKTVPYGQYSTPDSIASAVAALFTSDCNGPANARSAPGGVIYVQMRDGVALSQLTTNTYSSISFAAAVNSNLIQTTATATIGSTQLLLGQTTPINVQVSCNSACGSVDYRLDGGEWGTVALDANGHFTAGTGSNWSPGLHNVVIVYQGNGTYAMSTSNSVSFMISSSSTPPPQPTSIYSYNITTYQANGNVSAYTDSTASVNETWSNIQYDGLNRLTEATQTLNGTTQYMCWGYDSFGNRTPQTVISPNCYSSPPSAPTQYNVNNQNTALGYDASGDVTNDGTNQYLYDAEGRVCAVQYQVLTGGPVSMMGYLYDAEGRRVAKGTISSWSCDISTNGFTETNGYVLGPSGEQLTEVDGGGNWVHTNVYAAGSLIATYNPDGLHFHLDDWLGTRRVDTDYAGNPESTYHSLPFGEMVPSNQTISNTEHFYTGKEHDTESGLDYFLFRNYSSTMGRWMSPDPAGMAAVDLSFPQTLNRYAYVNNNPLSFTDPYGLDCAYLNNAGNGLESFDQNSSAGECGKTGGYWVNGGLTDFQINADKGTVQLTGTTNGSDATHASYQDTTVNVTEWHNTWTNPFNHIGIGFPGQTPVGMNPRSDLQFNLSLLNNILQPLTPSVPGSIQQEGPGRLKNLVAIPVTGMQAQMIQAAINNAMANPGNYSFGGRIVNDGTDCATWVQQVLGGAGVNAGSPQLLPSDLMKQLGSMYPQQR